MTVRRRLVVMNSLVVFIVLVGGGAGLIASTRQFVMNSMDRELRQGARRVGPMPFVRPPDEGRGGPPRRPPREFDPVQRPTLFGIDGHLLEADEDTIVLDRQAVQTALMGHEVIRTLALQDRSVRMVVTPVYERGRLIGAVQLAHDLSDFNRLITAQTTIGLTLLPAVVLLAALAGWYLADRALRPVAHIQEAAAQIDETDLHRRLPVEGDDEFAQLSETFNAMLVRLERSFERQKAFVADASHELRTPLARLLITTSSALAQGASEEELRDALTVADRSGRSMSRLVDQLLALARLDASPREAAHEVANVLSAARTAAEMTGADVALDVKEDLQVRCDPDDLTRILRNLIENAVRVTPQGHSVAVRAVEAEDGVELQVEDHGPGIAAEHLAHLGERFFRVEGDRSRQSGGAGLGLAIVKGLVERAQGRMKIESDLGQGTTVKIWLPQEKSRSK